MSSGSLHISAHSVKERREGRQEGKKKKKKGDGKREVGPHGKGNASLILDWFLKYAKGNMLLMQIRLEVIVGITSRAAASAFSMKVPFLHALKWLRGRGLSLQWVRREERRVGGRERERQAGRFRGEMFSGPCRLFLAQTAALRATAALPSTPSCSENRTANLSPFSHYKIA